MDLYLAETDKERGHVTANKAEAQRELDAMLKDIESDEIDVSEEYAHLLMFNLYDFGDEYAKDQNVDVDDIIDTIAKPIQTFFWQISDDGFVYRTEGSVTYK